MEAPNAPAADAPIPPTSLCSTPERLETVQSEQFENAQTLRRFEGARLQPCRQSNKMIEGFSP